MSNNHYEILGVAFDAPQSTIRQAYKRLAQRNHPDKGGDQALMQAIQKAYDILFDEERRARYDAGETDVAPSARSQAPGLLAALLSLALDQMIEKGKDPRYTDIVAAMRGALHKEVEEHTATQREAVRRISQRRAVRDRLQCDAEDNFMAAAIDQQIAGLEGSMKKVEFSIEMRREALNLLADYTYAVEAQPSDDEGDAGRAAMHAMMMKTFQKAFGVPPNAT